jgi:tRNA (mo5U34)-methyltransferase
VRPHTFASHPDWREIERAMLARVEAHGDYARWQQALDALPALTPDSVSLSDRVTAHGKIPGDLQVELTDALMGLHPWRKGPFTLFGVHVDSEWRSDWKWRRIASALGSLQGQTVLDVGSGNGYFGWRALEAGAAEVVGVDPSVLFSLQHEAICHYLDRLAPRRNHILTLPFEDLPPMPFDLVMSMGVIYHRKEPAEHAARLHSFTRPGGRVLLESLVVDADECLYPADETATGRRYARMRNVTVIPTVERMTDWLTTAGFEHIQLVDVTPTTIEEQRATDWMSFESLAESLDPTDPARTVEGYPAPMRAALLAHRPPDRTPV